MMVDVPILISALSLLVAIIVAITSIRSRNASSDKQEASQITTLIVKLENIADGVNEIKSDMRNVKNDVQDLRDRLIIVEQSTKSAHHRIDGLTGQAKED
ncbi:MAG: hypothetical protein IJK01_06865 [Clostridia bacterium]|nr:hypothetical protein [Clostridia bacterium]